LEVNSSAAMVLLVASVLAVLAVEAEADLMMRCEGD
jgi:hypothetical protein